MRRYECLEVGGDHQLRRGLCRKEQAGRLQPNHLLPGLDTRADGGLVLLCLSTSGCRFGLPMPHRV